MLAVAVAVVVVLLLVASGLRLGTIGRRGYVGSWRIITWFSFRFQSIYLQQRCY